MTSVLLACGVDIVGPPNLIGLLESIPSGWPRYVRNEMAEMLGVNEKITEQGLLIEF